MTQSNTHKYRVTTDHLGQWLMKGPALINRKPTGVEVAMSEEIADLEAQRDAAVAEARELREDKKRLDWLESEQCYWVAIQVNPNGAYIYNGQPSVNLRAALDQARKPFSPENQQSENTNT